MRPVVCDCAGDNDNDCKGGFKCKNRDNNDLPPLGVVFDNKNHRKGQGDYCYDPDWETNQQQTEDEKIAAVQERGQVSNVHFDWQHAK